MQDSTSRELLQKLKDGTLTDQERAILTSWYNSFVRESPATEGIQELERFLAHSNEVPFSDEVRQRKNSKIRKLLTYASAACISFLGIFIYISKPTSTPSKPISHVETEILPAGQKAILTLSNGSQITLDQAKPGELLKDGTTSVIKTGEGQIAYQNVANRDEKVGQPVTYNTLSTPKAGHYQVTLSDGSNVWLNAASSIRFPSTFNNKERLVEITGEAFLEVKKWNKLGRHVPFKVRAGSQVIEVLGTQFNVNSYSDETSIKTTLIEGSIKLGIAGSKSKGILLKPGEQAQLTQNSSKQPLKSSQGFVVNDVDAHSVVAWKNGYFHFNNIGLPELMRQISRWYDMEVEYEGQVKEYEFVGEIARDTKLSNVLNILESGGVNFRIEGRKIIVIK